MLPTTKTPKQMHRYNSRQIKSSSFLHVYAISFVEAPLLFLYWFTSYSVFVQSSNPPCTGPDGLVCLQVWVKQI